MPTARIKLISRNKTAARDIAKQIAEIAKSLGIKCNGPIPLPTRKIKVTTRKTPCGDGSDVFSLVTDRALSVAVLVRTIVDAWRRSSTLSLPATRGTLSLDATGRRPPPTTVSKSGLGPRCSSVSGNGR